MNSKIVSLSILITISYLELHSMDNAQRSSKLAVSAEIKDLEKILEYAKAAEILQKLKPEASTTLACLQMIPFVQEHTYVKNCSYALGTQEFTDFIQEKLYQEQEKYYENLKMNFMNRKKDTHDSQ